jgi:hypothetical protein
MPSPNSSDEDDPPPVRWVGRCRTCGKTVAAEPRDVARYMDHGWPRCCGEDMTLTLVREPPTDPA